MKCTNLNLRQNHEWNTKNKIFERKNYQTSEEKNIGTFQNNLFETLCCYVLQQILCLHLIY